MKNKQPASFAHSNFYRVCIVCDAFQFQNANQRTNRISATSIHLNLLLYVPQYIYVQYLYLCGCVNVLFLSSSI